MDAVIMHRKPTGSCDGSGVSLQGVGLEAHLPPQPAGGRAQSRVRKKVKRVKAERGGLLFTHRGVSGPAVLDMSHHAVMALQRGHPQPGVNTCVSWEMTRSCHSFSLSPRLPLPLCKQHRAEHGITVCTQANAKD